MLHTSFLKLSARETLKGEYLRCALGALILYIPVYISVMINELFAMNGLPIGMGGSFVTLIINIFVVDILTVGYTRSLYVMKDPSTALYYDEKRYDINLVLSGYQDNFKNTLKVMFVKRFKLFLWELLMVVPILVFVGAVLMMSSRPEVAGLIGQIEGLMADPTDEAVAAVGLYIIESCQYILFMLLGVYVLMGLLIIPYIRKSYEYALIPQLLAENPEMSCKEAFEKTGELMRGYRKRLFAVECSFFGWFVVAFLISGISGSLIGVYIAMALITPYLNTTVIKFYNERKAMLAEKENETKEGMTENEN